MRSKSPGVPRVPSGGGRGSRRGRTGTSDPGAAAANLGPSGRPDPLSLFLDVLVLGLAAFYLATLWRQAALATFVSDECFHAYLSEWIARRGRFPRELPEFY